MCLKQGRVQTGIYNLILSEVPASIHFKIVPVSKYVCFNHAFLVMWLCRYRMVDLLYFLRVYNVSGTVLCTL